MTKLPRIAQSIFGIHRFMASDKSRPRREDPERLLEDHELSRSETHCCGGYNEAFIVQYWTSYHPH